MNSPFGSDGVCRDFPMPKPRKQTAYMGVTPIRGAAIPLYNPLKPLIKKIILKVIKLVIIFEDRKIPH